MRNLKGIAVLLLLFVTNLVSAQGVYVPYSIVNGIVGSHGTQYDINDQDTTTFYAVNNIQINLRIKPTNNVTSLKIVSNNININNVNYVAPYKLKIKIYGTNTTIVDSLPINNLNTLDNLLLTNTDYVFFIYGDSNIVINELYLYYDNLTKTDPLKVENFYSIQNGYIEPTNNSVVQLYNINGELITELKEGNFKLENNFIYILNVLVGDGRLSKKIILR